MRPSERISALELLSAGGDPPGRDCPGRGIAWERSQAIKRELALVAKIRSARTAAAKAHHPYQGNRTFLCIQAQKSRTQDREAER
jgi:hypothetical protein